MNTHSRITPLRTAAIAGAFLVATVGIFAAVDTAVSPKNAIALRRDTTSVNRGQLESASYSGVVKRVAPSIVKVTVMMRPTRASFEQDENANPFPGLNDPALRQFFGSRIRPQ